MAIKQNFSHKDPRNPSSLQEVSEEYWKIVNQILYDIMRVSNPVIGDRVTKLRQSIESAPKQEQLLFYHQNPLNLVRDLSGLEPNEEAMRQYRVLVIKYPK